MILLLAIIAGVQDTHTVSGSIDLIFLLTVQVLLMLGWLHLRDSSP